MRRRELLKNASAALLGLPGLPASVFANDRPVTIEDEIQSSVEEELRLVGGQQIGGLRQRAENQSFVTMTTKLKDLAHRVPTLNADVRRRIAEKVRYWDLSPKVRQPTNWMRPTANPDIFHVTDFGPPTDSSFTLTVGLLRRLAKANAIQLGDFYIFGLRGAHMQSTKLDSDWRRSIDITVIEPNHIDLRCLIGVCDVRRNRLRLFRASTVPQVASMHAAFASHGWGASLLPAGKYRFKSGTHKATSRLRQPGALINLGPYVSLRTPRDLVYDPTHQFDVWTYGFAHNIHAAGRSNRNPQFDSAGCQVIPGGYDGDRIKGWGPWLEFQKAAGLANQAGYPSKRGREYDYFLMPAYEAALFDHGDSAFLNAYHRIRPGSKGERVRSVQQVIFKRLVASSKGPTMDAASAEAQSRLSRMRLRADGDFGALTSFAVLLDQFSTSPQSDPIGPVAVG